MLTQSDLYGLIGMMAVVGLAVDQGWTSWLIGMSAFGIGMCLWSMRKKKP